MPRTLVVGDIHGNALQLRNVLRAADYRGGDELIVLGDIIDRGPLSREAVDYLLQQDNCKCIRGNHETWLLECAEGNSVNLSLWLQEGGLRCLQSYGADIRPQLTGHGMWQYSAYLRGELILDNIEHCQSGKLKEFISLCIGEKHLDYFRSLPESIETQRHIYRHWQADKVVCDKVLIIGHEHHINPKVSFNRIELGLNRNRVAALDIDAMKIYCSDGEIVIIDPADLFG